MSALRAAGRSSARPAHLCRRAAWLALLAPIAADLAASPPPPTANRSAVGGALIVSEAARRSTRAPRTLVYVTGHLRTFFHLHEDMKVIFDELAQGDVASYAVYMHTWGSIEHNDRVWWRNFAPQKGAEPRSQRAQIARALADPRMNGFMDGRRFVARVDEHPGMAALAARYNVSALNAACHGPFACVDIATAQLHTLRMAHGIARHHLGAAAHAAAATVVRARPDTLLPDASNRWRSFASMERALGNDPRLILGHHTARRRGVGDVAFALTARGMDALLGCAAPGALGVLLGAPYTGEGGKPVALEEEKRRGEYYSEQVFAELLGKCGFRLRVSWFLGVAKARLRTRPDGALAVAGWHQQRRAQRDATLAFLRRKGRALNRSLGEEQRPLVWLPSPPGEDATAHRAAAPAVRNAANGTSALGMPAMAGEAVEAEA